MPEIVKHFFKLQFLLILVAIAAGIFYPKILEQLKGAALGWLNLDPEAEIALYFKVDKPPNPSPPAEPSDPLFTRQQLATYNGEAGAPLYLALLGAVYDVTKGEKHYGPGCAYNFFVGRDASVSFVTGEFEKYDEQSDDVLSLKPAELLSLDNWKRFYDTDYTYKGKLVGRFYDESGTPTAYHHKYLQELEVARASKAASEQLRTIYPDCNIEWSVERGTRVWCTTTSGGGQPRQWVGHPRKLFQVGTENFRCACIRQEELDTTAVMIKEYENCEPLAHECFYQVEER